MLELKIKETCFVITEDEAYEILDRFIARHGRQAEAARQIGVAKSLVSAMANRKLPITGAVLKHLGLRRVTLYEPIPENSDGSQS